MHSQTYPATSRAKAHDSTKSAMRYEIETMRSQSRKRTHEESEKDKKTREAFNHHEPYYDKSGMPTRQRQPETTTAYAETAIQAR